MLPFIAASLYTNAKNQSNMIKLNKNTKASPIPNPRTNNKMERTILSIYIPPFLIYFIEKIIKY